jgi:hypothetical protein
VCTENSVLIDYVTESPNVSGDDRSIMLLPDPVHLAVIAAHGGINHVVGNDACLIVMISDAA